MNKFIKFISSILVCVLLVSVCPPLVFASESQFPSETNAFVSNHYSDPIDQDKPFFDEILPEIEKNIKENNTHTVTPYYDKFPLANNPENFQGLGSTTYANINGQTVTAEAFYRLRNEGLNDPNNGMGLLIYQCIQYKRLHPEEEVKITFSSYRTSVTAAVCVIPTSKYYGYMRSLYGTNYDEQGFVRISYMLLEAARMGIEVTMVNQLNSYGVNQYNPETNSLKKRSNLDHAKYFNSATLAGECYEKYAPGKKVSDFMSYTKVGWTVEDKTSDMQHVKSATASHYLATDGTEHKNAVFFSSANLDENSYRGANGNNNSQSGVIISDHADLYRVAYNYTRLMYKYRGQEEMFELRKYVNEASNKQIELINSGRGDEIPKDEQIVYLGTENDPVFELYFTPFGGSVDTWDTLANPICKYVDKLPDSEDYVELIWNEYGYGNCQIGKTMEDLVAKAFCEKPNVRNKIAIRVDDFDTEKIRQLALGSEIGYRSINDGSNVHSKDILVSYVEDGQRHNVSLMTSCNFYPIAFSYRTNSLLVINETEESGGNFYNIFGERYSYNMINNDLMVDIPNLTLEAGEVGQVNAIYSGSSNLKWSSNKKAVATVDNGKITAVGPGSAKITVSDGTYKATVNVKVVECIDCYNTFGLTCNTEGHYTVSKKFDNMPLSIEAEFTVSKDSLTGTTTILGSDGNFDPALVFSLNKNGNPRIAIRDEADYSLQDVYVFDQVDVATGEKVHLGIVLNFEKSKIRCYVNGKLLQSKNLADITPFEEKHLPVIGGDHKNGNPTYFTGALHSLAVYDDMRTAEEMKTDYTNGTINTADENLVAAYDFARCEEHMIYDMSSKGNNLKYTRFWMGLDELEPVTDYEYSFAVIGDTQTMNEKDPLAMESIYDWILENKEDQKIEYVIGLGDITDDSTDFEWDNANKFINKLNGQIPYVLTRGNHDDWDDFNRHLHNGFYENTVDGMMNPDEISLTDLSQPGLIKTTLEDGTEVYLTREGDEPEGGNVMGDLTNSYRYFEIQGTKYLILTLDFAPTEAALNWANEVIKAHPDHKVIAITHAYMYRDGTTIDAGDQYPPSYYSGYTNAQNGDDMWAKCFSQHKNVVMVLSGHDPWQHIVYRQDKGVNNNVVTQMLIDPQYVDLNNGSVAMVAMFYFSNDGNTLTVRYYSVSRDCYGSPLSQFTIDLDKHTHTYETLSETIATLESDGERTLHCTTCGETTTETIFRPTDFSFSEDEFVYDGKIMNPEVIIKDSKGNVIPSDNYTVTYNNPNKNVGIYTATVVMKGSYSGSKVLSFKITPILMDDCTVELSQTEFTYDGEVKLPEVTVTNHKGTILRKGTHYTVTSAADTKKAGTYSVVVTMKGNYSGTQTLEYTIKPIDVSDCTVELSETERTYFGDVEVPAVVVKNYKGTILKNNTHYKVAYSAVSGKPGAYEATVTMIGNYGGEKVLSFVVDNIPTETLPSEPASSEASSSTQPTEPSVLCGDVDGNGVVNVKDATAIQKFIADIPVSAFNESAADVDGNAAISVKDATAIQKWIAALLPNSNIGKYITK